MKVKQLLTEEQILNEAPWTKGTAARAFKKSEKDEKKRKAHDIKVLAKDFSKEWEKAQFYLPKFPKKTGNKTIDGLNRSKPFTQEQWKQIFKDVALNKEDRSSPVFNLWHDATVLSPAGRILRRAGEDMTDAVTYLTNGNRVGDAKYYADEANVTGKEQEPVHPFEDPANPEQPQQTEQPVEEQPQEPEQPGEGEVQDPSKPQRKRPAFDASSITPETVQRFARLVDLANKEGYDFKVLSPDKTAMTVDQIKQLTPEQLVQVRVPRGGKMIQFGAWYMSTKSLKLLEDVSDEQLMEDILTEAPRIQYSYDDIMDPKEAPSISGMLRKAVEDERAAAEAKAKAERRAQLQRKHAYLINEIKEAQADPDKKPSDVLDVLYEELVPPEGAAETVAGELVRAIMRVIYRCYNDGDKFYEGYGLDTCASSVSYLCDQIDAVHAKVVQIMEQYWKYEDDDKYEEVLEELAKIVIDYIVENPETLDDFNEEDSRDYDMTWIADEQPKYDFEIYMSDDAARLIEEGILNAWDAHEYIEDTLRWDSELDGIEVDRPFSSSSTTFSVSNLTKDGLERLEDMFRNVESFWSDFVSEHQDELDELDREEDEEDEDRDEDEDDIDENLTESYPAVEFYSQRADDILSSMMDNADEKTIDETISSFRRAARKLGLRRYDDLIVFVDTEMMYDPAMIDQIVSTRAVEAHNIKGIEFCSQLVNGNLWLYFKSEDDGEKYMTIADLFNGNI